MIQRVIVGVFVAAAVLAAPAQAADFYSPALAAAEEPGHNPAPAAEPNTGLYSAGLAIPSGSSLAAPDEDGGKGKGKGGKGKGKGKGKGQGGDASESSAAGSNHDADGSAESDSHRSGPED